MVMMDDHAAHMSAADMQQRLQSRFLRRPTPFRATWKLPPSANHGARETEGQSRDIAIGCGLPSSPGSKRSRLKPSVVLIQLRGRRRRVVVVVHEIFGLSTWVRGVARYQVAAEGFIAIAPDFFSRPRGGPSADELTSDSAQKLYPMVNTGERNRIIAAAASYAMMQAAVGAAEVRGDPGYCWGGQTVWGRGGERRSEGSYVGGASPYYGAFP